jgi:hypothetical protein
MVDRNEWMRLQTEDDAQALYHRIKWQGLIERIAATIRRRSSRLHHQPLPGPTTLTQAEPQPIALEQIAGTTRADVPFDRYWRPLRHASARRWRALAVAMRHDAALPPVDLVLIDGQYLVRDGHYRVSVARALGREYLDAIISSVPDICPPSHAPVDRSARVAAPSAARDLAFRRYDVCES